jgi:hypothetical protein
MLNVTKSRLEYIPKDLLMKIFSNIYDDITLINVVSPTCKSFYEVVRNLDRWENIEFHVYTKEETVPYISWLSGLSKLRSLIFGCRSQSPFIEELPDEITSRIENLEIVYDSERRRSFNRFSNLKHLVYTGFGNSLSFPDNLEKLSLTINHNGVFPPCSKLTELKMLCVTLPMFGDFPNLVVLKLHSVKIRKESVYNLPKLKVLQIKTARKVYLDSFVVGNLEKLCIQTFHKDSFTVKQFVKPQRSLKSLHLDSFEKDWISILVELDLFSISGLRKLIIEKSSFQINGSHMQTLYENSPDLEHLSIQTLDDSAIRKCLLFKNLKNIYLNLLDISEAITQLLILKDHPVITELTLTINAFRIKDLIPVFTVGWINLKRVNLVGCYVDRHIDTGTYIVQDGRIEIRILHY